MPTSRGRDLYETHEIPVLASVRGGGHVRELELPSWLPVANGLTPHRVWLDELRTHVLRVGDQPRRQNFTDRSGRSTASDTDGWSLNIDVPAL
ncbi:hypothetical protein OHR68_12950 [Spirillospora sp. NBC_00431]